MSTFDDLLGSLPKKPGPETTPFRKSIIKQESGGQGYGAIGQVYTRKDGSRASMDRGEIALGKHQIVPKFWFDKVGLDPLSAEDRQRFLSSPDLQDRAFEFVIGDGEQKYPGDYAKQSAAYYGGAGGVSVLGTPAGDKSQSAGHPSVNSYAASVTGRLPDAVAMAAPAEETTPGPFDDILVSLPRAADIVTPDAAPSPAAASPFDDILASLPRQTTPMAAIAPPAAPAPVTPQPYRFSTAPIPGVPGIGGEKIAPLRDTSHDPKLPWDSKKIAEENRVRLINTAKGAEYMQAQAGASNPTAYPNFDGHAYKNDKPADLTPEAYQRRKMGEPTTAVAALGDVQKAATDYNFGLLSDWLSGKDKMEATGERMAQTEAAINHKRYLASPEYQNTVAVARTKQQKGDTLTPEEERALAADPGFWSEVGSTLKEMAANPGELGLQMLRDLPTMIISGAGIGGLMNAARAAKAAKTVNTAAQASKFGRVAEEAAQNIGGVASTNYPQAEAMGEDYGVKQALRDVVTGGVLTGAHMAGVQGAKVATAAEPKLAPAEEAIRKANNAIALVQARKAAIEAGLSPEDVETFLKAKQHEIQKAGAPLEFQAETVPGEAASTSDLNAKNSSSSIQNPSMDITAKGGGTVPGTPDAMAIDPLSLTKTWTGNDPTRQKVDLSETNRSNDMNGTSDNVAPTRPEVKPFGAPERAEKAQTLGARVRSLIATGKKIYLDDNTRAQLGMKETGIREYGPMFTKDKREGITLDGISEIIREQAEAQNDHYPGIGHGRNVQANDIVDAIFAGNQDYARPTDNKPEHFAATNDILRNGSDQFDGMKADPARALGKSFEAGGMTFNRIKSKDPARIAYKDEYGGVYDFSPDDQVHTGGEMKPDTSPRETAPATTPDEYDGTLFQKGPPKASQEDMFGNKGRTASEGFIKGKGDDKGLEGTPLFDGEKREAQAKAEEDQQRLFDPEDPVNRDNANARPDEEAAAREADDGEDFEVESPARVHVSSNLRRVAREVQEGRITPDEARQQIESLATRLDENRNTREIIRGLTDRARGQDFIREKLLNARRHGHMSEEAYQLTNWFVEQNPHLVDDLGISVRSSDGSGAAGHYAPFERVVTLMKMRQNTTTGVHEILHHTERMMPPEARAGILKAYTKQFAREFAGADFKKLKALELISRAVGGDVRARNEVMRQFERGEIPRSLYHLSNPSEYWAVNGSRIMADKHAAEGWVGRARQWLKEFIQHAKGVLGLQNDSAIIRGLRDVLRSDGRYLRTESLTERRGPILMDVKKEANPEPLYQDKPEKGKPKGSYHYDEKLKKHVITLFKGEADLSTLFHEHFHYLEQAGIINAADRRLLARALQNAGFNDPMEKDGRFKKDAAEKLARWYERYLRNGDVKVEGLEDVFGKVADMMKEIYPSVRTGALKDQAPSHIKDLFDRMENRVDEGEGFASRGGKLHQDDTNPLPLADEYKPGKDDDLERGISRNAIPGDPKSGFLTPGQAFYTAYVNRGLPIELIQKHYAEAFGVSEKDIKPEDNLKLRMMRVFGAGASVELHIDKNLAPIYGGGKVNGIEFDKLNPDEQRMVDRYALARDANWRYNHNEGFDFTPSFTRDGVNTELRKFAELEKSDPEQAKKIKKAADALVEYGKDLAVKKMRAGIWTEEQFKDWTRNPNYIPEIRDWSKVLAKPLGVVKKRSFTSTNNLARGTQATTVDAPIFDPMTALIHDSRQLASEAAKGAVWKKVVELVNQTPDLKDWIKKKAPGQEAEANQGEVSILGTVNTHLGEAQRKVADRYQDALFTLERLKDERRNREDDYMINLERRKTMERVNKLPAHKRPAFSKDMGEIFAGLEADRQAYNKKKEKKANDAIDEFRKLPEADRHLIEDYLDEGKPVTYIVPKELAEAVNGMNPMEMTHYRKTALAIASFFRKAAVTWNPAFTASNVSRDLQEAYFNTGMNPLWAFKSIGHAIFKDAVYEDFIKNGGGMSGDESGLRQSSATSDKIRYPGRYDKLRDKNAKIIAFGKEMDLKGLNKAAYAVGKTLQAPFDLFAATAEVGELMTRLGVFKYGQKMGLSKQEATLLSRQSTIDFNRIGAKMSSANAMLPFLNARIQGLDRIIRTGKNDPGAAAVRAFAAAGLPTLLLTAWNMQNPNYSDIPSWEKEYYWILMNNKTGQGYTKIAKGNLAQFLTNPMQMIWENAVGTAKYGKWDMARSIMKAGMPIDDPIGLLTPLEKTAVEQGFNKNWFFNRDIVRDPARSAEDQWDPSTSEFLKVVGHRIKFSPARMQHLIQSVAAGTGTNALYIADAFTGLAKGLKSGEIKAELSRALKGKPTPLIGKFVDETQTWKSDFEDRRRKLMREMEDIERSIHGKGEFIAGSMRDKPPDKEDVKGRMKRSSEDLKDVMKELGEVGEGIRAIDDLVDALEKNLPGIERHPLWLKPPRAKPRPQAPQAPSDAIPEDAP